MFEDRPWFDPDAEGLPAPEVIPVAYHDDGVAIPDLSQIDELRWVAVLRPLDRRRRRLACLTAPGDTFQALESRMSFEDLPPTSAEMLQAVIADQRAVPVATAGMRSRRRQVNFRIEEDQYALLVAAARRYGVRPTELARLFTMSGVNRALEDRARG